MELNDVVFSIHASVITAVTIAQCFVYEVKLAESIEAINLLRNFNNFYKYFESNF